MKRIVYFASILFLASTITSCQKEIQKDETTPSDKGGVTVNVVADGNLVSDDASKTAAVVDGKTTKFKWTEGDAITLYEYVDGALNDKKDSDPATISDDGYSATFTVKLTKEDPEGSNYVYTACYPTGAFTSTSNYDRYQIPNTQTLTADGNFDPAADIMFGKTEPRSSRVTDETNLEFSFKRLGTAVKLTLKGIEKDEAINNITITAPEKIAGYSEIDFKTGVVGKVAYDAANSLKLNSGEEKIIASGNEDGDVFWFRCIEGTWKGGDKFTIVVDTDKAGYTKEITIPAGGLEFSTGGFTKLTIGSLTRTQKATTIYNKVTEAPGDWSGEYLLVYEKDASNAYIWTGVDAADCYATTTISDNSISSVPQGAVTLTIATMKDGYSIKVNGGDNDGKYIYGTSGSNALSFKDSECLNTISYESNVVTIVSNTSVLRYNNASNNNRFRYFKSSSYSSQQPVQLYKLEEAAVISLAVSGTPEKTSYKAGDDFETTGLVVKAKFSDASEKDVTDAVKWTVTPSPLSAGTTSVSVVATYKGVSSEAKIITGITVSEPATLESIAVKTAPSKVTYTEGEKFDPTGLVISRNYSDATSDDYSYADHESEFSFSPALDATLATTDNAVTITYKGKSCNQAITVNEIPALETMDAIFAAATAAGGTATAVKIKFTDCVVTGVKNSNAYLTDANGTKGLIIYTSSHGFEVGDKLNGKVDCKVQLYNGSAELTELKSTTTGLTVTKDGTVTPQTISIANLSGVNTGAVISFSKLSYDGTNFTDGTNSLQPYNTFMTLPTFDKAKKYNITGVFIQFKTTKEIAPRTEADIEAIEVPYITATPSKTDIAAAGETITVTVATNVLTGWTATSSDNTNFAISGKTSDGFNVVVTENKDTENGREATITVSATGVDDVVITLNQSKASQGGGETAYTKVTSAPTDWSGTYIIAYVNKNNAFVYNGTDSGANNGVSAKISDNKIEYSDYTEIEIAKMEGGYSLKVVGGTNNGKYLSGGTSNGTSFNSKAVANSISLNTDGTVKINNNTTTSFQFNSASDQQRFRYFKSAQKGVNLFKK